MNIVIVNDFAFVNGGAGQVAINTAKLLANSGENVILFTAVGPIADELLEVDGLEVICLEQYDILNDPFRLRAIVQGIWNYKAGRVFTQVLRRYSPKDTVIHIHTLQKAVSTSVLSVASKMGFKILYHGHDYGIACPNLGFYDYQRGQICHRNAMSVNCIFCNCDSRSFFHKCWRVVRQIVQKYMGGLPGKINCFIYISKFSRDVLEKYLIGVKSLEFLPNIVDVVQSPRVKVERNHYIIFIGRMSPEKNPQQVARVTKELNLPVLFIGGGALENEIKRINPAAKVTGWISRSDMKKYIQSARVLVFPSKWYEAAAPLTILEAMAYGVPCVVSEACAGKDVILDGINGLTYPSDDDKVLMQKLILLNNDQIEQMSRNAYNEYWEKNYNENVYIDNLKSIYRRVLQREG